MKKLVAEGLVIFTSIFASFSVENYRESSEEKELINDAVITLGDEISSNIEYTKEHLKQVENMHYVASEVVDNFDDIELQDVFQMHSDNPYIYSIIENGELEYTKKYFVFAWWNAWEPENVFFQSMLYSGKLLEIKNKKLRREIESIYTKQEERVNGMSLISKEISKEIGNWFIEEQNKYDRDVSISYLFKNNKNQKLKNVLARRESNLNGRKQDLENYLQALQNVVLLISTEYKKLD